MGAVPAPSCAYGLLGVIHIERLWRYEIAVTIPRWRGTKEVDNMQLGVIHIERLRRYEIALIVPRWRGTKGVEHIQYGWCASF